MQPNTKIKLQLLWEGFLNSYAQVFFSTNKGFAMVLLLVSFFDLGAGISGVLSIVIAQVTILAFNFNHEFLRTGSYTYNVLMVGIAMGMLYEFNLSMVVLLLIVSVLTLFITIWYAVAMEKKGLPFLSIPFLFGIWVVMLGAANFTRIELNVKETLSLAECCPYIFETTNNFISSLPFNNALHLYFRSLGAIFFQFNDLAGIFIAIGLLYFSRIAFGLSIFGFAIGYLFYMFFEGDFTHLIYSYIGFNFILTSIALGGFFIVPTTKSYLMMVFTIPVIAILISALHTIFIQINLPLYSLPFNIVALLYIATMLSRYKASGINLVAVQHYSPEKNHYKFMDAVNRFKNTTQIQIQLPVIGEWRISQGHNGDITHKDDWKHAWDFDIVNSEGKTYTGKGLFIQDYLCYNLPVVAPADGEIIEVLDGIADNNVGDVNLHNNWGNTIIIKHGENLYSKLSHLLKGSINVKAGDYVTAGQKIGTVGNSGRSPEPHLHFQLQATPYIGSKTLNFLISQYINLNGSAEYKTFDIPKQGDIVCNIQTNKSLKQAFNLVPGKTLRFKYDDKELSWEVFTDAFNHSYIYCHNTKSCAYFVNNGKLFYFTHFYGKKESLLHAFYLGAYKVLLGFYNQISINEEVMIDSFLPKPMVALHDFTAPFFHYCKAKYKLQFVESGSNNVRFETHTTGYLGKRKIKEMHFTFKIKDGEIESFTINNKLKAVCVL